MRPTPASKPTNVRWLIVVLLMGFTFLGHFNRISITVAANANFIGPGKLSEEQMGLVYSAFLFVYTLGMLPGGWLIDRLGPRFALAGMGLGLGFCAGMTGTLDWLGLTIAAMWVPLMVIRGVAGSFSVPLHPGAARAVSLWLPLTERSTANGLVGTGALVGIAVTYPAFGVLMDRLGWPTAFIVCGAVLMIYGLIWLVVSADRAADHRWTNDAERRLAGSTPPRTRATVAEMLGLLRNRGLLLLTLSYGAIGYVQYMFFYWIEYYFGKVLKLPPDESREAAFVVTMAMAAGMGVGGWVSDWLCRWLGHSWGCRIVALGGMGLSAAFCLLGVSTTQTREVVWWFSLSLGAMGLCEGIFWTTAPTLEPRSGGLACALMNTGGNGIGMIAPVVTPAIGVTYGWNEAIWVACTVCIVGALLWLGIGTTTTHETHPSDRAT